MMGAAVAANMTVAAVILSLPGGRSGGFGSLSASSASRAAEEGTVIAECTTCVPVVTSFMLPTIRPCRCRTTIRMCTSWLLATQPRRLLFTVSLSIAIMGGAEDPVSDVFN
eukprot:CAMPEP_0114548572 /NCGR_PEP_ID=MMETSP0114-20121206/5055_1 /TAXON_ID=31324 /ORGANISM="Goniomonas sp, Strain m" /LENGTH=110 /DNA_ID=CAMNT_0001733175 /DNA_START=105 /DNA_END=437 /DNA_ORIENTATION=+